MYIEKCFGKKEDFNFATLKEQACISNFEFYLFDVNHEEHELVEQRLVEEMKENLKDFLETVIKELFIDNMENQEQKKKLLADLIFIFPQSITEDLLGKR